MTQPIYKHVPRSWKERLLWAPWRKTRLVLDESKPPRDDFAEFTRQMAEVNAQFDDPELNRKRLEKAAAWKREPPRRSLSGSADDVTPITAPVFGERRDGFDSWRSGDLWRSGGGGDFGGGGASASWDSPSDSSTSSGSSSDSSSSSSGGASSTD